MHSEIVIVTLRRSVHHSQRQLTLSFDVMRQLVCAGESEGPFKFANYSDEVSMLDIGTAYCSAQYTTSSVIHWCDRE